MRKLAEEMKQAGNWNVENLQFAFKDGRWSNGSLEIDEEGLGGTEWICDIDNLLKGYRMYDERLKKFRYALVGAFDDIEVPARGTLGFTDETQWSVPKGATERKDPWRHTYALPLFRPANPTDPCVYFAEASGIDIVADLLDAYTVREDGLCPRVRLGARGPNKKGFYSPVMTIIEWVERPETAKVLRPPPLPKPAAAVPQLKLSWYDEDSKVS